MTKEAVKYVIEDTLGEALNMITPLLSVRMIKVTKAENKFPRLAHNRFEIDTVNELFKCYICRKYTGEIPSSWVLKKHYDIYDGVTYKYLFDETTMEPYVDVYDLNSIVMIEA